MKVHLFIAVSSPTRASYALKRTACNNEDEYRSEAANTLRRNFYVDDVLKLASTEDETVKLAKDTKAVCWNGGFNLIKFVGNSERIIRSIPQKHRAEKVNLALGQDKLPTERALGVICCIALDTFNFRIKLKDKPCTRRGILSAISSIYDCLGFIAPVVLVGKEILQDICHTNSKDEPVDGATHSKWERCKMNFTYLNVWKYQEAVSSQSLERLCPRNSTLCLMLWCVATDSARILGSKTNTAKHVSFVMGKVRVMRKKTISIPRLGLAGASVSVKIGDILKDELEYESIKDHYWTHSRVVLSFMSNESGRFHVYVANRVQLIRVHSTSSQWHYVKTASNTADEGWRGMSPKTLLRNHDGSKVLTSLKKLQAVGRKKRHTKTTWTQIPQKSRKPRLNKK